MFIIFALPLRRGKSGQTIVMSRSKQITIALHGLIWCALLTLPFFLNGPPELYGRIGPLPCNYFSLSNVLHIGLFYLNAFFLYSWFMTRKRWWLYVMSLIALTAGSYYIKDFILHRYFPQLAANPNAFQFTFFPTIFFLVISTVYRLVLDKMATEKTQAKREAEKLATELKFLRSQVSPHFLFNVLNNLVSMARHKSDQLEPSLIRLADLIRYMLYESDEKKVPINREIEYLMSYIDLQKLRFQEDVEISADIDKAVHPGAIEPMLLIPFVENAFKHGIALVHEPFIRISLKITGNNLLFNVQNKFASGTQSKDSGSGIGLANTKARLALLYPDRHKLSVTENGNIFHVDLSLQLK